jgi:hypothetical protein
MEGDMTPIEAPVSGNPNGPDYEVGYKRPPIGSRFQEGQSGNPRGRPKGSKGLANLLRDSLYQTVRVREGNRVQRRAKIEVALNVLVNQAVQGDSRALSKVMEFAQKFDCLAPPEERITKIVRVIVDPKDPNGEQQILPSR